MSRRAFINEPTFGYKPRLHVNGRYSRLGNQLYKF